MESIVELLGVELRVPDYTTLSRRMRGLELKLPRRAKAEAIHLVVDSTGLKVYGEGEWKVRQHGYTKRRTWRKLQLGADESSGQIEAVVVTTNDIGDGEVLGELLDQVELEIKQVTADETYDTRDCYKEIDRRGKDLAAGQ